MSPARETAAITFGAAAALPVGVLSWFFLAPSGLWAFAPMVAVGCVAAGIGALLGEWIATSGRVVAALLGALVLPATEAFVLGVLFAADTAQRVSLNRPPHWAELFNPRTWAVVAGGAVALGVVGAVAALVARHWTRRIEAS